MYLLCPFIISSLQSSLLSSLYRKNSNVTDPKEAWRLHNMANDILAYQKANCEHAEAMYIAGWGVNKVNNFHNYNS